MKSFIQYITEQVDSLNEGAGADALLDYFAGKARAQSRMNNAADRIRSHFKEHKGGFDAFEAHARNGIREKHLNNEIIAGHSIAANEDVHPDVHDYLNKARHLHGVYGTNGGDFRGIYSGSKESVGELGGHIQPGASD